MAKNVQAMPLGYKRSDVALMKTEKDGTTKAVMKDNTVWLCAKPGELWVKQGGGDATTQSTEGKTAAVKAPGEQDAGSSKASASVDNTAALKEENAELKLQNESKDRRIAELEAAHNAGPNEGKRKGEDRPKAAPTPMAGGYPADINKMPTVDEINARNGQPESA